MSRTQIAVSPGRVAPWLAGSVSVHALVLLALVTLHIAPRAHVFAPTVNAIEVAVETPRAPETPPPPQAIEAPLPPSTPLARAIARPVRAARLAIAPPAPAPQVVPPAPTPPAPTPPTPVEPPVMHAADVLRASQGEALRLASLLPAASPRTTAPSAPMFEGTGSDPLGRATREINTEMRADLAATMVHDAPGVRAYLWNVRRRVVEAWRPGVVRVPSLAQTFAAGFGASEAAFQSLGRRWMARQRMLNEPPPRLGGAADAIEAIGGIAGRGPDTRQGVPTDTGTESWRRNVRTTRAEVDVEQDEAGRVTNVRVATSSGLVDFDRAAATAVRLGVEEQDPIHLPGGRRSRWSFTVVATRRLFAPSAGGSFDESRGWFQISLPGQVSVGTRVQMESSASLAEVVPTRNAH